MVLDLTGCPSLIPSPPVALELPTFIEQLVLHPTSPQAIGYNGKDDQVVHLSLDPPQATLLATHNKVEQLVFLGQGHLVIGFKDQSIKCSKLEDMEPITIAKGKKVKK